MEGLREICSLFARNVQELQSNLSGYQLNLNDLRQDLAEGWSHINGADGRIISAFEVLLSSVNEVNSYIFKLNLLIKLNSANILNADRNFLELNNNNTLNQTNRNAIVEGELDTTHDQSKRSSNDALQLRGTENCEIQTSPKSITNKICDEENRANCAVPVKTEPPPIPPRRNIKKETLIGAAPETSPSLTILRRKIKLLPPKGGTQMSSEDAYTALSKNIASFVKDSVVLVTMMHLNIAENCIFVSKWGPESKPLKKLLEGKIPIQQLDQLPDFGDIFAVHDAQEQIIPRVLINAHTEGGGYEAYLLDYGEHIHLNDDEVIFSLPKNIKALPAEAVKCYVRNHNVAFMKEFTYKEVRLRILANNGNELEVELLEHGQTELTRTTENSAVLEALNEVEPCTSDALKAVLGYKPKDDQRICRHYDPKLNGCFKGSNCRLLHQPLAPHGATKDRELAEPLPECTFVTEALNQVGSVVNVLVTFISSPTQLYVQFQDQLPPLVWAAKEIHETQRRFKRAPRLLDIVLALYSDDCYYRAQIVEVIDGIYKIFYVDYGNTEFVTIKSLAHCHSAASFKPHRAINCLIAGIKCCSLMTPEKRAECVEFLKSNILNKKFDVKLIGHEPDGNYTIMLLNQYAKVTEQLLQRGYVEPTMDVYDPKAQRADIN